MKFSKIIISISIMLLIFIAVSQGASAREAAVQKQEQITFGTPEEAVNALLSAIKDNDEAKMEQIFGSKFKQSLTTSDKKLDQTNRMKFYNMAQQHKRLVPSKDGRQVLVVGTTAWPFPIPLVKQNNRWRFETESGIEEITNRRIGENELAVISLMSEYVKAQNEYASKNPMGSSTKEYAQKFLSSDGKKDGLYWPSKSTSEDDLSPLGPMVAKSEGYLSRSRAGGRTPFHGYYFRILNRQGQAAPGGRMSYMRDGHMTGGFALVAYPADYGRSGVMTFIVNQDGKVYEKNLGNNTQRVAENIVAYNPDRTWSVVKD